MYHKATIEDNRQEIALGARALRDAFARSDWSRERIEADVLYSSLLQNVEGTQEGSLSVMAGPRGWRIAKEQIPIEKSDVPELSQKDEKAYEILSARMSERIAREADRQRSSISVGLSTLIPDSLVVARQTAILEREARIGLDIGGRMTRPEDDRSQNGAGSTKIEGIDAGAFASGTKEKTHADRWSHVCDVNTIEKLRNNDKSHEKIQKTDEMLFDVMHDHMTKGRNSEMFEDVLRDASRERKERSVQR